MCLIALDGLVIFTDGSLCEDKAGAGVFSSYHMPSALMLRSFNPKYMLFWRAQNIPFRRAFSTEQYQSALVLGLLYWPLNRMPCLPKLYYSAEILLRN
jgi:hypothetical protein